MRRTSGAAWMLLFAIPAATGCFYERSHPIDFRQVVHSGQSVSMQEPQTVRDWLRVTQSDIGRLLPPDPRTPLTTEQLVNADGTPRDVFAHFELDAARIHTLRHNAAGLAHTAQVTGSDFAIHAPPPEWDGFEDVWIPVCDQGSLSGRLGLARNENGTVKRADCIMILPGLLGDNARLRVRDMGQALRKAGFHVLALELRGHGQTLARYPDMSYHFGLLETGDLLTASEWLEALPAVRHTGLIGFSWSSDLSLLASWEDGRPEDDASVTDELRPYLRPHTARPHFQAGILCLSPVLDFEVLLDKLESTWTMMQNPVLNAIQETVLLRIKVKSLPRVTRSLRELIKLEFDSAINPVQVTQKAAFQYLRLLPYKGMSAGDKLEWARVPVLLVHGANDPLAPSQAIADFISMTSNPNVAAIVLPGGGHDGFAAYSSNYLYSLVLNFFDPQTGAAAIMSRSTSQMVKHPSKSVPDSTGQLR